MNDLENFTKHIANEERPDDSWPDLVQSLWWVKKGNWEKAHLIAQEIATKHGSWVHAYLHRQEGDSGNAAYWYQLAGKSAKTNQSLEEEWNEISQAMLNLNGSL